MQHENVPVTHAKILQTIGPQYSDEPEYLRLCQDVSQEN